MKKFFWLMTGVAAGLVIAKQIESNPRAQAVVDDATAKAKEFGAAIAEGFKEREAEISTAAAVAQAKSAAMSSAKAKSTAKANSTAQASKPVRSNGKAKAATGKPQQTKNSSAASSSAAKKTSSSK